MVRKYTDYLKGDEFVQGEVKTVSHTPQEINIVTDGQLKSIPYDYLVVALGTTYEYKYFFYNIIILIVINQIYNLL